MVAAFERGDIDAFAVWEPWVTRSQNALGGKLRIIQDGHIRPAALIGSWAGAFGQTQFMPTTFFKYAADGDGDGKIDLWRSAPDALASTAVMFVREGWQTGKPWGYEVWWARTDRYVGKHIHINKGHALSLQYHNKKDETIFVFSGKILFEREIDGKLIATEMGPGDAIHVVPPTVHRMTAIEETDVFEVSTPETDDVVRLEDRYGRKGT